MRFQFPQFIEQKTNIVGPLNLPQFLWVAAGGSIVFMVQFFVTNQTVLILIGVFVMAIALALGFLRVDGNPLPKYITTAFMFMLGEKRYIYKKRVPTDYYKPPKQDG